MVVNDRDEGYDYPQEVRFEISEQEVGAYQRAADFLNLSNIDVLSVQHEFGIYGGASGGHVLGLLRSVRMPVVTTLHTVLQHPSREQRRIFDEILSLSSRLIVMAGQGAEFIHDIYGVTEEKIDMGRDMVWSNVAHLYAATFSRARREDVNSNRKTFHIATLGQREGELPTWRFDHLLQMTDHVGIFQHAIFTVPNFSHGYCTDDNARALILMTLLRELGEKAPQQYPLPGAYAAFLQHAFNADTGRFRNFMGFNRKWLEDVGSEDSHGRALWALGTCVGRSGREDLRGWAANIFEAGLSAVEGFTSPRAWAFTILGVQEYLRTLSGDRMANQLGNCGSPMETSAGWLLLTHGVGAMRKYCIGAVLLDRDDPSRVIGRLKEPLIKPEPEEREGYVPNVVYSCGALIHNGTLVIPYAISDSVSTVATVPVDAVIEAMTPV